MRLPLHLGIAPSTVYDAYGRHILTIHATDLTDQILRALNDYARLRAEYERVSEERDALLAACEAALEVLTATATDEEPAITGSVDEVVSKLQAAIRKAKGGDGGAR